MTVITSPKIIGLTGYKGAGKDTAGALLVELIPGAQRLAFADALRQSVSEAYGGQVTVDMLTDAATKETPIDALQLDNCTFSGFVYFAMCALGTTNVDVPRSPRQIMQLYGSWQREKDPHFWVKALARLVEELTLEHNARYLGNDGQDAPLTFIITDVRYRNEATYILGNGGHIAVVRKPVDQQANDAHSSEQGEAFPLADFNLWNDGTRDDLRIECTRLIRELAMEART